MYEDIVILPNFTGYLPGARAIITFTDNVSLYSIESQPMPFSKNGRQYRGIVPWGQNNLLPEEVLEIVYRNPVMTTGLLFNIQVSYGQGIQPFRYVVENNIRKVRPVYDNKEINTFFEENNINGYLLEQMTDLNFFYNVFPEIILNRDVPEKRKIISLNHKEACFSRWDSMNPATGEIEYHFYSAEWSKGHREDTVAVTPVLSASHPIQDLRNRIARGEKRFRYIVPVNFPTPGKTYYQKPYWYSIIESGWADFASQILTFKKALLANQMSIKYHVQLADNYFEEIFAREGITDDKRRKERVRKEYKSINDFLSGEAKAGKSVISYVKQTMDGKEFPRMKITALENHFKGGEYIEDTEEVSNIMSYGLGVHPSLIGASPGKNKGSFSGTDKRELFIIKQALLKPVRDMILRPFYLIKAINRWPEDIQFGIPDLVLTTLDENTGSERKIS